MRVRNNRLYPYPVYTTSRNDYLNNEFSVDSSLEYDSEIAELKLNISISDDIIVDMIKKGIVGIFCHVESPSTKYRDVFPLKIDDISDVSIKIPLQYLNNNIEVLIILVALENIDNYINPNLNENFIGESIYFPQFATIGFTDTDCFKLIKKIDKNGEIPSIFTITKDENADFMHYDNNDDKISIFLPNKEFDIYNSFRGRSKRLKQMMINLPVLVQIFEEIKSDNSDAFLKYSWYDILEKAVEKQGFPHLSSEDFKNEDALKVAQKILGNILQDAFSEFDTLMGEE